MIAWIQHPFLPHEAGYDGGVIVGRCVRTMNPDIPFVVQVPGSSVWVGGGDTAQAAKRRFECTYARRKA